jgi:chitin disaccharide deacetylase
MVFSSSSDRAFRSASPPPIAAPAKRKVIINGDDFGVSTAVNQAIIAAHARGVLTSTSLMMAEAATEEAIALAHAHPTLAVGLHLVVACGRSVLPPSQIPNLVDAEGNFSSDPNLTGLRYSFDRAAQQQLKLEIRAQLERFRATGLPLSHVDGHVHLHLHPVVLRYLLELAAEFNIRFIRLPVDHLRINFKINRQNWPIKLLWWSVFSGLSRAAKGRLEAQGIGFSDRVYGILQSGNMTEEYLLDLIPQMQSRLIEIYSHPSFYYSGDDLSRDSGIPSPELAALLSDSVRNAFTTHNFERTNYLHC